MGLRASDTRELLFKDCRVPSSALLGSLNGGFKIAMRPARFRRARRHRRPGRRDRAGGARGGRRLRQGPQAVRPSHFRIPTHPSQARGPHGPSASTRRACWSGARTAMLSRGQRCTKEASMAKLFATTTANRVAYDAVQDPRRQRLRARVPDLERYFRDARAGEIYEGTSEIQEADHRARESCAPASRSFNDQGGRHATQGQDRRHHGRGPGHRLRDRQKLFVAEGARVAIVDVDAAKAADAARTLDAGRGLAMGLACDVRKPADCEGRGQGRCPGEMGQARHPGQQRGPHQGQPRFAHQRGGLGSRRRCEPEGHVQLRESGHAPDAQVPRRPDREPDLARRPRGAPRGRPTSRRRKAAWSRSPKAFARELASTRGITCNAVAQPASSRPACTDRHPRGRARQLLREKSSWAASATRSTSPARSCSCRRTRRPTSPAKS